MVETVIGNVRLFFLKFLLTDEFDPIAIGIQCECNILHSAFGKFLLKLYSQSFQPSTCILQRTDGNADLFRYKVSIQMKLYD